MIPFGKHEPDLAQTNSGRTSVAENVRPQLDHYAPLPGLAAYSSDALAARARGGIGVRLTDGTTKIYAGDANALYELANDKSWTDRTRLSGGAYSNADYWWMLKWGSKVIAGNLSDINQVIDADGSSEFADISVSAGTMPKSLVANIVGPHIVAGCLDSDPTAVQLCAAADETNWEVGGGVNGRIQSFKDHGWVRGVSPGRLQGYIYPDSAIRRAILTGDNNLMDFLVVVTGIGIAAPTSLVHGPGFDAFLSNDGFKIWDGHTIKHIGRNRVDNTFNSEVDQNTIQETYGSFDPNDSIIYWPYRTEGGAYADRVAMYNYISDRWAFGSLDASVIFQSVTLPTALEDIDTLFPQYNLDTLPWSLDDRIFQGQLPSLAAFGSDNKLSFFTAANLAATIETSEFTNVTREGMPNPRTRLYLNGAIPIIDSTSATVSIGTKERKGDSFTFGSDIAMEADGSCPQEVSGRFVRGRLKTSAGDDWTKAEGIAFDVEQDSDV